ncbi:VOC family protein [Pseudophaeobacter leonis]|uniref:VOC family protein n=1 Tax=Pseudophaeobacter leonis TaxID=1144477 RepID=UPI0009F48E8E|nr:VOC family protein [Pseudophaeobacter leonis]
MKLKLHHINLCSSNVPEMDRFYRDVLTLEDDAPAELPPLNQDKGLVGEVAFVTDGDIQMHLTPRDVLNSFRSGHVVNPLERGHIAYRTDDMKAFMKHLDAQGVRYSDWGSDAVKGWHQVFFYDPEGNVIEVHQIVDVE